MASIFLCHSSRDKKFVRKLASNLQSKDVSTWLDEAEIKVGESLTNRIGDAIGKMEYFGVVLSQHSVNSEWVQRELQIALQRELKERKVIVLPLLLEKVKIPPFLQDKKYADFTNSEQFSESFRELCNALELNQGRTINATNESEMRTKNPEGIRSTTESQGKISIIRPSEGAQCPFCSGILHYFGDRLVSGDYKEVFRCSGRDSHELYGQTLLGRDG